MKRIKASLKKKDVVFTLQRYGIEALGAVAQGPRVLQAVLWLSPSLVKRSK